MRITVRFILSISIIVFWVSIASTQSLSYNYNKYSLSNSVEFEGLFDSDANIHPLCTAPKDINILQANEEGIIFIWGGPIATRDSIRYRARYRLLRDGSWSEWSYKWIMEGNEFVLDHPKRNSIYEIHLQKICDGSGKRYENASNWVFALKQKIVGVDFRDPQPIYSQESCDNYAGADYEEIGGGSLKITVIGPPAATCGGRYMVRYLTCSSNDWQEAFILEGNEIVISPGGTGDKICEIQIRAIVGGCGEQYDFYCPWKYVDKKQTPIPPDANCGDTLIPPYDGTTPLSSATTADFFTIAGMKILLDQVSGSNGSFSGSGELVLPYQDGIHRVSVEFTDLKVNNFYQVYDGQVTGIEGDITQYVYKNLSPLNAVTLNCKSNDPEGGWDENGINKLTGGPLDPFGFDINGNYGKKPPYPGYQPGDPIDSLYDPNGFDKDGNYIDGGKYNPAGCSRDSIDIDGNPCDPGASNEPYWWLRGDTVTIAGRAFYETIKDSLRIKVESILNSKKAKESSDTSGLNAECDIIRDTLNIIMASLGYKRDLIFGPNDEYFKKGLSKRFASKPRKLEQTVEGRAPGVEDLEKKHIELYECDKSIYTNTCRIEQITYMLTSAGLDSVVAEISEIIKYFSKNEAQEYSDNTKFMEWLDEQIEGMIEAACNEDVGVLNPSATPYHRSLLGKDNYDYGAGVTYASIAGSPGVPTEEDIINQANFDFHQGRKYINGIHRAFYLERVSKAKALNPEADHREPVNISNEVNDLLHSIYLDNIVVTPDGGTLNAYYILDVSVSKKVVFEAEGIHFGPGGNIGNARLKLLNDFEINLFNHAKLKVIGSSGNTYVDWHCYGFAEMSIEGDIDLCRKYLTPLDNSFNEISDPTELVTANFVAKMQSIRDFTANLTFEEKFYITDYKNVKWDVKDAMIDYSAKDGLSNFQFPSNYSHEWVNTSTHIADQRWKGFILKSLSAYLPEELNNNGDVKFDVSNVIIDNSGFTGKASLTSTIVSLDNGSLGGWAFSIENIHLGVLQNQFQEGGFGGLIKVPVFEEPMLYDANIEKGNKFDFAIALTDSLTADAWWARVKLNGGSYVTVGYDGTEFNTTGHFNGSILIKGTNSGGSKLRVPKAIFEGFEVGNKDPWFTAGTWGVVGNTSASFGGFDLVISNFGLYETAIPTQISIGFSSKINLSVKSFTIGGGVDMHILGIINGIGGQQSWDYQDFDISKVSVDLEMPTVSIKGYLQLFDNHSVYGKGFRGVVDASVNLAGSGGSFGLKALAQFGKIKQPTQYKYFMVDLLGTMTPGIPLGGIDLIGVGGGLFYNMERPDSASVDFGRDNTTLPPLGGSLSGIEYTPKEGTMEFKASAVLGLTGSYSAFNANVSLGATFKEKALQEINLDGNAQLLAPLNLALPSVLPANGIPAGNAAVKASCNLNISIDEEDISGNLVVYANALNAFRGAGANDLMGTADIYFKGKSDWRIWVGTPKTPVGVVAMIPYVAQASVGAYLCLGSTLPPLASLDGRFAKLLPHGDNVGDLEGRTKGKSGIMFGSNLKFGTGGEKKYIPIYYSLSSEIGFDFSLAQYSGINCGNMDGPIGINGWYGTGQIYASLEGNVGVYAKLFGKVRKYDIGSISSAAALQGGLPNPFFAQGGFTVDYSILNGLRKGKVHASFALGEPCQSVDEGEIPELLVINSISPSDGSELEITGAPKAIFNVPVNKSFKVKDLGGNDIEIRTELDYSKTKIEWDSFPVRSKYILSSDQRYLIVKPYFYLRSNDSVKFTVKVNIYKDGALDTVETRSAWYYTGDRIKTIPIEDVLASYPVDGMQNFYKDEYRLKKGFIKLKRNPKFLLLDDNSHLFVRLTDGEGNKTNLDVEYDSENEALTFDLSNLTNEMHYTLELVIEDKAQEPNTVEEGNELENGNLSLGPGGLEDNSSEDVLLTLSFRCSKYNTFKDKMNALMSSMTLLRGNYLFVVRSTIDEGFDEVELGNNLIQLVDLGFVSELYDNLSENKTNENKVLKELYAGRIPYKTGRFDLDYENSAYGIDRVIGEVYFTPKGFIHQVYTAVDADAKLIRKQINAAIGKIEDIPGDPPPLSKIPEPFKALMNEKNQPTVKGRLFEINWLYTLPFRHQANSEGTIIITIPNGGG